jgi:hypothetical protein
MADAQVFDDIKVIHRRALHSSKTQSHP